MIYILGFLFLICYKIYITFYKKQKILVSIDGLPGVGKTTLIEHLRTLNYVDFVDEPVNRWLTITSDDGESILEKFYKDKKKYGFPFQILAYITRLIEIKKIVNKNKNNNKIIIMERSLDTDKYVFELSLYDSGAINTIEHKIYGLWFDHFIKKYQTTKVIYIKASADVCKNRIIKRNRRGEENIAIEYLEKCIEYHENMIKRFPPSCVLIIDGNEDITNMKKWIDQIEYFIKK